MGVHKNTKKIFVKLFFWNFKSTIKNFERKKICGSTKSSFCDPEAWANPRSLSNSSREFSWKNTIRPSRILIANKSKWTDNNACWKSWTRRERSNSLPCVIVHEERARLRVSVLHHG